MIRHSVNKISVVLLIALGLVITANYEQPKIDSITYASDTHITEVSHTKTTLETIIADETKNTSIPPQIIQAMIKVESNGDKDLIGDNGEAFGLMQVQPKWHAYRMQRLKVNDLLDPRQNIRVAVDYLKELYEKYGNLEQTLTAYNAGHDNGTREYYNRVMEVMNGTTRL